MSEPFQIKASTLKKRKKPTDDASLRSVDEAADTHGFTSREPKRGGRKPSPRTGQIHAKVLPLIRDEILEEAAQRGVTQGVLLEEAWELYKAKEKP